MELNMVKSFGDKIGLFGKFFRPYWASELASTKEAGWFFGTQAIRLQRTRDFCATWLPGGYRFGNLHMREVCVLENTMPLTEGY